MLKDTNHHDEEFEAGGGEDSSRGSILLRSSSCLLDRVDFVAYKAAVDTYMPNLDEGEEHDSESENEPEDDHIKSGEEAALDKA